MKLLFQSIVAFAFVVFTTSRCNTRTESDKANVEEQNKDKFQRRDEKKDAQFVVDAIDASYAIIEVAQLGEQKGTSPKIKGHAKEIIEGQTSVVNKLKTYAEDNDISVPFSGPQKTRARVEKLYDKNGQEFDKAWLDELQNLSKKIINDFENYMNEADDSLRNVVNISLDTLRSNQEQLAEILLMDGDNNKN
jgi:putative membrane protein